MSKEQVSTTQSEPLMWREERRKRVTASKVGGIQCKDEEDEEEYEEGQEGERNALYSLHWYM